MKLYRIERGNSVATATDEMMNDIYPILHRCSLFEGIPEKAYSTVLICLRATRRGFCRGSSILNIGDRDHPSGLALRGTLEISLLDENGSQIILTHMPAGSVFGIAMACAQREVSPVRMQAIQDCELLFLDFNSIMNPELPLCPYHSRICANLLRDLSRQTLFLNQRLQIIGQKRLRNKIKIFLQCQPLYPDRTIVLPFKRSELADYLYADRSALSRELGRMAKEGILEYKGHTFRILDPEFLKS